MKPFSRLCAKFAGACLMVMVSFGSTAAIAQEDLPAVEELLASLETDMEELRRIYQAPGFAIAIVKDGETIYAEGFGHRDIQQQLPTTPETIFPTASVTKQFTAALLGMQAGLGELSLSDRPAQHLPELRFNTDEMNNLVTISDLLSHQSGIGVVDATHVFFPTNSREKHLARLQNLTPNSAVRERFDYSNMGYAVASAIDERISGRSWESQVEDRIFRPLGMARSSTTLADLLVTDNVALGYGMIDGQPHHVLYEDQYEAGPSGGINSSVLDLANWITMLLNDGRYNSEQVVPAEFLADAFSAHAMINPTYDPRTESLGLDGYGYGWFVSEFEGRYRVNHGGNTSGFTARIDMLPGEDLGIAILTNQGSTELPRYLADLVYRRMLSLPPRDVTEYPLQVTDATAIGSIDEPNQEAPPSHEFEAFIGRYFNAGYGSFDVSLREGRLYANFPAFSLALEHQRHDVFSLKPYYEIHQNSPSFPVNFQTGYDGIISGAMVPLQTKPVLFVRQLDEDNDEG